MKEVVKIGTRAIISIADKPMLATHRDGYPKSLGRELLRYDQFLKAVIEVAKAHIIDAASSEFSESLKQATELRCMTAKKVARSRTESSALYHPAIL